MRVSRYDSRETEMIVCKLRFQRFTTFITLHYILFSILYSIVHFVNISKFEIKKTDNSNNYRLIGTEKKK